MPEDKTTTQPPDDSGSASRNCYAVRFVMGGRFAGMPEVEFPFWYLDTELPFLPVVGMKFDFGAASPDGPDIANYVVWSVCDRRFEVIMADEEWKSDPRELFAESGFVSA